MSEICHEAHFYFIPGAFHSSLRSQGFFQWQIASRVLRMCFVSVVIKSLHLRFSTLAKSPSLFELGAYVIYLILVCVIGF